MKFTTTIKLFSALLFLFISQILPAQNLVRGKIIDSKSAEVMVGATVVIKGTTVGAVTDYDGLFEFKTAQAYPLKITVSSVGYESMELEVANDKLLSIKMSESATLIGEVVITEKANIDEKKKSGPTVETVGQLDIKQAAGNFYDEFTKKPSVDLTTAAIGYTIINTRGFNSTSPVRSLQIIDGVDNQAPGLNFSLGNFLGSSELDVLKADLMVGANSAYYGPNAFNGVMSIDTKNPFFQKGLSARVKTGERELVEVALRYADALKNKDGKDWFAYKFNFFNLKAYDWVADNYEAVSCTKTGVKNPGSYDAVNTYGDEREASYDFTRINKDQPWNNINLGQFHRTGYNEVDMVDYNTKNTKANAALHFRLKPSEEQASPELIIASNFGSGTTVYQGDNRFSLKNILFFQNRIEIRKRDKYFFRIYATNENSGDSYDPYFTSLLLQQKSKITGTWGSDYTRFWRQVIDSRANALGYPQLQVVFNPDGSITSKFDQAKADKFIADNTALFQTWHNEARAYADTFKTDFPYFVPGTQRFKDEFNRITKTKSSKRDIETGGTGFYDKSALYHGHGEYRFQPKQYVNEWVVGGNFRLYTPQSQGTIFVDTAIYTQRRLPDGRIVNDTTGYNTITNSEVGVYTGIEKRMRDNKWKFNATIRMDKNQNFGVLFSPAASLVWQPDKVNYVRAIFSSAIRNPTLNDQFLNLNVGRAILSGNIKGFNNLIDVESFATYIDSGLRRSFLRYFDVPPIRPEKVKSLELGYRTTIMNKTYVDMSYYYSFYRDFIGFQIGVRSDFDPSSGFPKNIQGYRVAANAKERVTTQGFSIGINHYVKNYIFLGNYSWNILNTKTNDPIIPAFNTPAHKFNLGITGRDVQIKNIKNVGFSLNYKWIQGFQFQGSPQFTGSIPTYDLVDGQINYTFTKINTLLKIGATNMLNKKQYQVYGGPRIGRMAYISIQYDWNKK